MSSPHRRGTGLFKVLTFNLKCSMFYAIKIKNVLTMENTMYTGYLLIHCAVLPFICSERNGFDCLSMHCNALVKRM